MYKACKSDRCHLLKHSLKASQLAQQKVALACQLAIQHVLHLQQWFARDPGSGRVHQAQSFVILASSASAFFAVHAPPASTCMQSSDENMISLHCSKMVSTVAMPPLLQRWHIRHSRSVKDHMRPDGSSKNSVPAQGQSCHAPGCGERYPTRKATVAEDPH